ncbi:MAG: lipopolysaccharide transport periplasmic protein LptA [Deltaproteobacteria bacterium]|nr:lipopolysaccharide transport periplasmic protein LptA [Deltaproteobacteria bacterium]
MKPWGIIITATLFITASAFSAGATSTGQIEIKADALHIQSKKKVASFSGHVRLVYNGARFSCDRMTVHYNEKGTIRNLEAEGHVTIIQEGATAEAQRATLDTETGTIRLLGNPRLVRDGNTLSGKTITFNTHTGEVTVTEASGTFIMPTESR